MSLKIAIIGTRGIPNNYGGFEELATKLSVGLVRKGHEVVVYNSHNHPYREASYEGVNIQFCYDPEYLIGSTGQFLYDLNCIIDARKRKFDIILFLGYTSSSLWYKFFPQEPVIITNMDGMEWKRMKYGSLTRRFLRLAEKLAVKFSDTLVADSSWIQNYLDHKYSTSSNYISYGADIPELTNVIDPLPGLLPHSYYLLIARMEKENNIEMILDGYLLSHKVHPFIVVGNISNNYGRYIENKYRNEPKIIFPGSIYDKPGLHSLIANSKMYFHGHSVGGTNPSLLEAMAAGAFIIAHDNPFNRSVLDQENIYFNDAHEVSDFMDKGLPGGYRDSVLNHIERIQSAYQWSDVIAGYEKLFYDELLKKGKKVSEFIQADPVHQVLK